MALINQLGYVVKENQKEMIKRQIEQEASKTSNVYSSLEIKYYDLLEKTYPEIEISFLKQGFQNIQASTPGKP